MLSKNCLYIIKTSVDTSVAKLYLCLTCAGDDQGGEDLVGLRSLGHPHPAHLARSLQDVGDPGPDQHPAPRPLNHGQDVVGDLTAAAHWVVRAAPHKVTVQSRLAVKVYYNSPSLSVKMGVCVLLQEILRNIVQRFYLNKPTLKT